MAAGLINKEEIFLVPLKDNDALGNLYCHSATKQRQLDTASSRILLTDQMWLEQLMNPCAPKENKRWFTWNLAGYSFIRVTYSTIHTCVRSKNSTNVEIKDKSLLFLSLISCFDMKRQDTLKNWLTFSTRILMERTSEMIPAGHFSLTSRNIYGHWHKYRCFLKVLEGGSDEPNIVWWVME